MRLRTRALYQIVRFRSPLLQARLVGFRHTGTTLQNHPSRPFTISSAIIETNPIAKMTVDQPAGATKIDPMTETEEKEAAAITQLFPASTTPSNENIGKLNEHLSSRTTILGSKESSADITIYHKLRPLVKDWTDEQRTGEAGFPHVTRFVDYMQHSSSYGLHVSPEDQIPIDPTKILFVPKPIDPKLEKERKKKEAAAAKAAALADPSQSQSPSASAPPAQTDQSPALPATTNETPKSTAAVPSPVVQPSELPQRPKKEKPKKEPRPANPPKNAPTPLSPSQIDLRVGHILLATAHPDADSLYVSTIACGDPPGTEHTSTTADGTVVRTVCSGLAGLVPLSEMQDRLVVVVCNLKPVTMRGVKSAAMVLAASPRLAEGEVDSHKGPVELVMPPEGAQAGEKCFFEGFDAGVGGPEKQLNPKKKVFETLQPGFATGEGCEVRFEVGKVPAMAGGGGGEGKVARLVTEKGGVCRVKSLAGATVR